ncbi:uncharacterized protein TEOVI_000089500 [Trypanosoma equiperdum]|uniref:Uncharacterized protein n=2 Tax=Trypanozoon TaxID=39700 RepID=Q383X9_TRYB2|nr:hypothetical protein, conserved [Trypanosoma brucei brucei TREU927]EAN79902.1 hypothetical protein, conserved [Trypanosoma brucei brucei TREU927]SCU69329.1 hypothetical protein, conserved [Trypanosoma equiperdum]
MVSANKSTMPLSQGCAAAAGIPLEYFETRDHINHLISLGMPRVTPHTVPPKERVATLPVPPQQDHTELMLTISSGGSPQKSYFSTTESHLLTCGTLTPKTARKRPEIDSFDMEGAFAALVKRLESRVDEEDNKDMAS